jgi:hypothetical protein
MAAQDPQYYPDALDAQAPQYHPDSLAAHTQQYYPDPRSAQDPRYPPDAQAAQAQQYYADPPAARDPRYPPDAPAAQAQQYYADPPAGRDPRYPPDAQAAQAQQYYADPSTAQDQQYYTDPPAGQDAWYYTDPSAGQDPRYPPDAQAAQGQQYYPDAQAAQHQQYYRDTSAGQDAWYPSDPLAGQDAGYYPDPSAGQDPRYYPPRVAARDPRYGPDTLAVRDPRYRPDASAAQNPRPPDAISAQDPRYRPAPLAVRDSGDRSGTLVRRSALQPADALAGQDPLHHLRNPVEPVHEPAATTEMARSVLSVMRERNWVTGLLVPIVAAIAVGVAAVVIAGANTGTASQPPSALAAGFPPARSAVADFTGATVTSRVLLDAIAASGATQVVAGSADGHSALWVSPDGGNTWGRATIAAEPGGLTGVAHGTAGWLTVGTTGQRRPLLAGSPNGQTWTLIPALNGTGATAVAAGPAGYVIVGRGSAWYARGLTGWRRAALPATAMMAAVSATSGGFTAVGTVGTRPAAWLSATGKSWTQVQVPVPGDAARAALDYVAANGRTVAAVGTEVTTAGAWRPFAIVSADGGGTWKLARLPAPGGAGTVTALTAAGAGFIATGTDGTAGNQNVVIWTLPPGSPAGAAWTEAAPLGIGLSGAGTQAITALTAQGATVTGIGFTTSTGRQRPTIWQSPIRF